MPLVQMTADSLKFTVENEMDIVPMQDRTRRFSLQVGLSTKGAWSMAISVSEAATNIVKYASSGSVSIWISKDKPARLIFEALDNGTGITDLENALQDRVSCGVDFSKPENALEKRKGLGLGLGTIQRMMDHVTIENRPQGGLRVMGYMLLPQ